MVLIDLLAAANQTNEDKTWIVENATWLVGIVAVVVSGVVGPSVTAWFTGRREAAKDHRSAVNGQRENLRDLLDELACVLAVGVAHVNTLAGPMATPTVQETKEAQDFIRGLAPLEQRLRLRLPEGDAVIATFEMARKSLEQLGDASLTNWDEAVSAFEEDRKSFLEAGRLAVQPRKDDKEKA